MRPGKPEIRGRAIAGAAFTVLLVVAPFASIPARGEGGPPLFSRLSERSWTAAEPARTFGPANLYEEIDGEAELFLPYGFRELSVGIFRPSGNDNAEVRLELFRHETPRDAFGIYSQHRFPGQETIRVGTSEAIVSATSLDFFRGTVFVRLRTASREASRNDLEKLGRDLSDFLAGTGGPPCETRALRIPGMVDGSIVFQKRAILGYEVLAPGYEAKYESGGISATLILIDGKDAASGTPFVERLSVALPGFSQVGEGLNRADLPSGTLWLMARDGFHVGVAGRLSREQAREILSAISRGIPCTSP